jgi:hypothetical protein
MNPPLRNTGAILFAIAPLRQGITSHCEEVHHHCEIRRTDDVKELMTVASVKMQSILSGNWRNAPKAPVTFAVTSHTPPNVLHPD